MTKSWQEITDELYFEKGKPLTDVAAYLQSLFPDLTRKQVYEKARKRVRYIEQKDAKANTTKKSRSWSRDPKTGTESFGGIVEFPVDKELTPEDVMKAWKLDVTEWECTKFKFNVWQANAGEGETMNLYQCEICVKPITFKNITLEAAVSAIKAAERKRAPKRDKRICPGMLASLEVVDLHFNKLGSKFETGETYNPDVAEQRFWNVLYGFKDDVESCAIQLNHILFPIGGDFFNSDTVSGTTTGGTPQDNVMRPQEAFKRGYELVRSGIAFLSNIAPVDVILTTGNHDFMTSYYMAFALSQFFIHDDMVTIDYSPMVRKYREFGVTGLCFAHGDKDRKRLARCVIAEARNILGKTKYFEVHTQHLHEEDVTVDTGIIIRTVGSLTGTDAWHHQSGFVGARTAAQSFFYDKDEGLKYTMYHNG